MKKSVIVIIVIILVIGGGAAFLYMKKKNNKSTTSNSSQSSSMSNMNDNDTDKDTASSSQNQTASETNEVSIEGYAYKPANITVKVGTTVTWTNKDSVGHTVTPDDSGAGFGSELLAEGDSYSFKFDKAGTYAYHCKPHPYMKGTVTVTQ